MTWQARKGDLLGNVADPMSKDATVPELNRKARQLDLEVGRRTAARFWALWPLFLTASIAGFVTVIVISVVN